MKPLFILALIFSSIIVNAQNGDKNNMKLTKTTINISLEASQYLTSQGVKIAKEKSLNLSIAIVDSSGNLMSFVKMDDAAIVTINVAISKAKTSAYLKSSSKTFEDIINNGQVSMLSTPNVTPLQGGIPIKLDNKIIGAVGVSGSTGEIDSSIANTIANLLQ